MQSRYMNWVGVVTASLSVAPVFAQDSTEEPAQRDRGSLEEVVVTARNRTELAQEVPIPISVLSGDVLNRDRVRPEPARPRLDGDHTERSSHRHLDSRHR